MISPSDLKLTTLEAVRKHAGMAYRLQVEVFRNLVGIIKALAIYMKALILWG